MKIINYSSFIEEINKTKHNNYICTILLFYTGDIMSCEEDTEIEDEENFYNIFSDLIYYIETKCCDPDEQNNFKKIIDDLVRISSERKLDKIDVNYILFKEKIKKIMDRYKNKKITEKIFEEQICRIFEIKDHKLLLDELKNRFIEKE